MLITKFVYIIVHDITLHCYWFWSSCCSFTGILWLLSYFVSIAIALVFMWLALVLDNDFIHCFGWILLAHCHSFTTTSIGSLPLIHHIVGMNSLPFILAILLFLCWPEYTIHEGIHVVTNGNARPVVANEDNISSEVTRSYNVFSKSEVIRLLWNIVLDMIFTIQTTNMSSKTNSKWMDNDVRRVNWQTEGTLDNVQEELVFGSSP